MEQLDESEFLKWEDEYDKRYEEGYERGYEEGYDEGYEEGIKEVIDEKNNIILELLKSMSPEKIADKTKVSLSEILEIADE